MNVAAMFKETAARLPEKTALCFKQQSITFKQLDERVDLLAAFFMQQGLGKGTKTLMLLTPSLDFSPIVFALFKIGAVPVFLDPGMGRKNLLECVQRTAPTAMVSIGKGFLLKFLFAKYFKSVGIALSARRLSALVRRPGSDEPGPIPWKVEASDQAAILFTSGGTGIPKGVVYTHSILCHQTNALQEMFELTANDSDCPGFPLFSLFTLCMGMTSCLPDMNPSKPAKCNPEKIVNGLLKNKITFAAGSPAIWERVADYCLENKIVLPDLRILAMFGAPVRLELHRKFFGLLPNGTTHTPYGATEALPVSCVSGREILSLHAQDMQEGQGTCLGYPAPDTKIKIIRARKSPLATMKEAQILPPNEVGEIIVQGAMVTAEYHALEKHTLKAKIKDGNQLWHRMGDLGYLDLNGQLWFVGRAAHRVELADKVHYSIPCEAIFNQHSAVKRSALIGPKLKGEKTLAVVIERKDGKILKGEERKKFQAELMEVGQRYAHTKEIATIFQHNAFPVDVRHNIKIDRERLSVWAEEGTLGRPMCPKAVSAAALERDAAGRKA